MKAEKVIPQKSSRLLIFAVILFSGLFYLYYPHLQNYSTTPKWIFASLIGLAMLFLGRKEKFVWSWGMSAWFGFVLLYFIQSFWSCNVWDSIVRTIPFLIAPLLVVLIRREVTDLSKLYSEIALVVSLLILPILFMNLVELFGLYLSDGYSHQSTYTFRYSFGNRNQYSELLTLLVPILAVGFNSVAEKWKKILFIATAFLIYLTVTLLLNRAAFLVLYGVYPFIFILFLLQKAKPKTRKIGFGTLAGIGLLGMVLLASPARKNIPFLQNLLETNYGSGNERIRIWSNSFDLWKESPVFGKGSGDWKIEILKTPLQFTQAEGGTVFFQRAHNDFIQIAVENGLVGLVLILLFFGISSFLLFKSDIARGNKILLFAGVLGYLVISNFSFPIEKIELLLLLFLFFLPGLSSRESEFKKLDMTKWGIGLILVSTLILSLSWIGYEKDYFLFKGDNDNYAFEEINKSRYSIDPTSTPLFWHEGNTQFNKEDFPSALEKYNQALKHNPYHVHVINNIGSSHYALGEIEEAEKHFKKALSYNPKFVETLMNYSSLQFNRGNIDGALNNILSIPEASEPANYKLFILAITKAKYQEMIDKYDDPEFEIFLNSTKDNDALLYDISKKARLTGASFEMELRAQASKTTVQ